MLIESKALPGGFKENTSTSQIAKLMSSKLFVNCLTIVMFLAFFVPQSIR